MNGLNGASAINCYSAGVLNTTSTSSRTGVLLINGASLTNCYYLDGIQGTTRIIPETGATVFYKTSEDEEAMTTAKVVAALNNYIELKGLIAEGDAEVNTTGWCKWVVGEDNLPALDFNTEWNGTTWVTTNN